MTQWVQNDTWPPQRGRAEDQNGDALPLPEADLLRFIAKHTTNAGFSIMGTATVIEPPDSDGFNWQYTWRANDLANIGTYHVELEITWDNATTPPRVETVPNGDPEEIVVRSEQG